MKKIFSMLLLCATVASAPGCKDKDETPSPKPLPEVSGNEVVVFANRAALKWVDPAGTEFNKVVVRIKPQSDAAWLIEKTVDAGTAALLQTDLAAATTYAYSIQTQNAAGELSEGVTGTFTTKSEELLAKVDNSESLWSIAEFSSQETEGDNGYATNAIDGKVTSFWSSVHNGGDFGPGFTDGHVPQYIVIDLKKAVKPTEIHLYRRNNSPSGPTSVKIETSTDFSEGATPENDLGTFSLNGATENGALPCVLWDIKPARYIKITVLQAAAGNIVTLREVDVKVLKE